LLIILLNGANGADVEIQDSSFSKIENNVIYYLNEPKINISFLNLNDNLTIYLDNVAKHKSSESGFYVLSFPDSETFNLKILDGVSETYNQNLTSQSVKVSDISTVLTSSNLLSKETIKYKVLVNNNEIEKDSITLKSIVSDEDNNIISDKEEIFSLSSNSNLAKSFSFIPDNAGDYKIKNEVYIEGFLVKENEKLIEIQITRPEISLSLSRNEITVPSDIVTTMTIQNTKVSRDYDIIFQVIDPRGDIIEEITREINVPSDTTRSSLFQLELSEEQDGGEYILLSKVSFEEGGETYEDEEQRTLRVITPSANVVPSLNTPEIIEVSKEFAFILSFNHLSTKQFRYYYQCHFYDKNNFLSYTYPQNPNSITLGKQEQKDLKLSFTIPSDFKTGKYIQECKITYGNEVFKTSKEFQIKQPNNYLNLRAISDYHNGEAIIKVGHSTKSIKELIGFINIFLYDENGKLIDSDLNNEVTIESKLKEFSSQFNIPEDVPAQDIRVQVELEALDETLFEEFDLIENRDNLELYCSSAFVTPQNNKVSCSVAGITSSRGSVYIGIVRDGVEIPRIFRPNNKALLMNVQEKPLIEEIYNNETDITEERISELSFNLNFNNIRESKAKIIAVFVDENGLSSSQEFPVIIIPKGAEIGQTKTYAEDYFEDDKKKPLGSPNSEFQQEVQIKSLSSSQIKVKIKPISQNDRLIQTGDSRTLDLAPNSALTLTFLHKQLSNELLTIAKVSYLVFLISDDGTEYLIDTKEVDSIAPKTYYIEPNPDKTNVLGWIFGLFIFAIIVILLVGFYKFNKRETNGSSDMSSASRKPHESYEGR
jgi:hypothetical protein